MVVDGIPDPHRHRLCRRCQRWFDPSEGKLHAPELTGPLGAMRALRAAFSDDPAILRFQCFGCTRVRRITMFALFAGLFGLIALAFFLKRFGVLG